MNESRWRWAASSFRSSMETARSCYLRHGASGEQGYGYSTVPWWAWLLARYILAPAFGFEQGYIGHIMWRWDGNDAHETRWPYWPGRLATWLHFTIHDLIEPHERHFRWNAPLSDDPCELGFHSVDDGKGRSPWRCFVGRDHTASTWQSVVEPSACYTGVSGGSTTEVTWLLSPSSAASEEVA